MLPTSTNPLLACNRRVVAVTVEYTTPAGTRAAKAFSGAGAVGASRRFYAAQLKAGADPKVVGAQRGNLAK